MIGRIDEVVVDCAEPLRLARFWSAVLGGEARQRDETWCYVDPPGWTRLAFQAVPESKTVKNRAGSLQVMTDPEGMEWCLVQPPEQPL